MRLIDADALKKLVKAFRNDAPQSSVRKYVCDVILSMLGDENQTPTIEAEPVRHGRWEGTADGYWNGELVYDIWNCSECGFDADGADEKPDWNYCPNCGAKMDGGSHADL